MASFTVSAPVVVSGKTSQFTGERVVAAPKARAVASKAVTTCSLETRREAMGVMIAGATLFASREAMAAPPAMGIKDFKTANSKGFQEIYEARELDNDTKPKAGEATRFALKKLDVAGTKARVSESGKRIEAEIPGLIDAEYYPAAREELRRQIGYLRFDLNALVSTLPKDSQKAAKASKDDLVAAIETLDFELRSKNKAASSAALKDVVSAFGATTSLVL